MTAWVVILTAFGAVVLLTAWLPMVMRELPLSLPMVCVGLGAAGFALPVASGYAPNPTDELMLTEHVTEVVVIVSLMGAGLRLDRRLLTRSAIATWRLLVIAMPLTIGTLFLLGWGLLGLAVPAALLLASVLAPTDPVLASDVQVGPPGGGAEDETRFTLTAEAGLNDGLAFPFVNLALLAAAMSTMSDGASFASWIIVDVLWKIGAGAVIGWLAGQILGWITFRIPNRARLARTGDGFVALGITAMTYGLAEMAHGYGFIAVFVAAVAFRSVERDHGYHTKLHEFAEQLERLLMMVVLVLFGGALSSGGLLLGLSWQAIAFAVLAIFLVRPLAGWISLGRAGVEPAERAVVAFFGIRGIGSAYYLAHALREGTFAGSDALWTTLSLVVLVSIILHGSTVTPVMSYLDRRRPQ